MPYTEFTLWLLPSDPLRSVLRPILDRLSVNLDTVRFDPHVTIFCGSSNDAEACAVADRIARRFSPIDLTPSRLAHTERYTKTLFLEFQDSVALRQMFEMAQSGYARRSNYVLNPHLSLLYGTLPEATQRSVCETLDVPMDGYRFDRIRMIETELPINDPGPVERWRVVCEAKLLPQSR